jgi:uncharacterized membrane protein
LATLFGWVATLAAGLFGGAALYVSLVEHPARLSCGASAAIHEFRPSYRRGTFLQAPLAIVGALAALGRWATDGSSVWLLGGLALGALVPFTLVVILPTNKRLLSDALEPASAEAQALLARWSRLHAVRTVVSLGVFAAFVALTARR